MKSRLPKETKIKKGFVIKDPMGFYVAKRSKVEEQLHPEPIWTWDFKKAKFLKSERKTEEYIKAHQLRAVAYWTGTPEELEKLREARR